MGKKKYNRGTPKPSSWVAGGIDRITLEFFLCPVENRTALTLIQVCKSNIEKDSIIFMGIFC